MNKKDLGNLIAEEHGLSKKEGRAIVENVFELMAKELRAGNFCDIRGLGKFTITQKKARKGRNPQTGETIQVPPKKSVHFKISPALKKDVAEI